MSTAIGVIDNTVWNRSQVQTTVKTGELNYPKVLPEKDHYLENSEFYQIKGGFSAEVISNPAVKLLEHGILRQVMDDMRSVTLKAFGKTERESDTYTPDHVMKKNAIFVDYLTVVRKNSQIVAFTSGSYLGRNIFYVHATMVSPEYQSSGLGIVPNIYIWNKIIGQRNQYLDGELRLVCRTRNKNVASLLTHIWSDLSISGDSKNSEELKEFYAETAKAYGDLSYDKNSGIAKSVYPDNLPSGLSNKHTYKYNSLFQRLGSADALYISGTANRDKMNRILRKEIAEKKRNINLMPIFNENYAMEAAV